MKALDEYMRLQEEIFEYFGYVEDWAVIPIDDRREYWWECDGNAVTYAETEEALDGNGEDYYEDEVYTQRHLPKWVYEGKSYTMICVDTHVDLNRFLAIYDNRKRHTK